MTFFGWWSGSSSCLPHKCKSLSSNPSIGKSKEYDISMTYFLNPKSPPTQITNCLHGMYVLSGCSRHFSITRTTANQCLSLNSDAPLPSITGLNVHRSKQFKALHVFQLRTNFVQALLTCATHQQALTSMAGGSKEAKEDGISIVNSTAIMRDDC
jgi:hypothetical protein